MQMGKIKSAIITAIVVLATAALFLFGVVSCELPDGVNRYNSILSNVHLGSELTGDAYATLLPEGVITAEEYDFTVADEGDKADEYRDTYVPSGSGAYYVDRDTLGSYTDDGTADTDADVESALAALAEEVESDAAKLAERFASRNYTSYSVSAADGCAIRVNVPTNFTYAAYTGSDNSSRTDSLSEVSTAINYLTLGGELTLRNNEYGIRDNVSAVQSAEGSTVTRNILKPSLSVSDVISSASYYAAGGSYAVRINLTSAGRDEISRVTAIIADTDQVSDQYIRFYVGETNVINLTCDSQMTEGSFYIQVSDEETARNYASLLNSAANGGDLSLIYSYDEVVYGSAVSGVNSAMFLAIAVLVIFVALAAFAIARYRRLGLVFSLIALLFCSAVIAVIYLVGTTLTTLGVFTALLTLAVFAGTNFWSYEAIRKESEAGRTLQASVKLGYKKTLTGILELHIVLLVISVMLALIGVGEVAACGMVLLIGTLASYLLHWFTRFMWYVTMSPARDKYKFCGFSREAFEEDD